MTARVDPNHSMKGTRRGKRAAIVAWFRLNPEEREKVLTCWCWPCRKRIVGRLIFAGLVSPNTAPEDVNLWKYAQIKP